MLMTTTKDLNMTKILLIEDDPIIARGLEVNLQLEGYEISWKANLNQARTSSSNPDLIILDLGLPDGVGFEYLKELRSSGQSTPVIILSARSDEDSVVEGLQLGANDYLKKPFGHRELLARIQAVLRKPIINSRQLKFAEITLHLEKRTSTNKDQNFELNRREFDILAYMMERPEIIITRESLLQFLDKDGEIFDRTIDSHISHLRGKLKKAGVSSLKISSVYGLGYRLEKP